MPCVLRIGLLVCYTAEQEKFKLELLNEGNSNVEAILQLKYNGLTFKVIAQYISPNPALVYKRFNGIYDYLNNQSLENKFILCGDHNHGIDVDTTTGKMLSPGRHFSKPFFEKWKTLCDERGLVEKNLNLTDSGYITDSVIINCNVEVAFTDSFYDNAIENSDTKRDSKAHKGAYLYKVKLT